MQERAKPLRARPSQCTMQVTIDAELAQRANSAGIDLSQLLERALKSELVSPRQCGLSDADRAAIEWHNKYIEEHGSFADEWRKF